MVTPHVVYARGSVGRLYGPPNSKGYVQVKIGGCYLFVNAQDLQLASEPYVEEAPLGDGDTPPSGGYQIRWRADPDLLRSDPDSDPKPKPRPQTDEPFGLDP